MTSSKYLVRLVVLATLLLTLASLVFAQDYRGKVQGSVKDENGSAILGAQVVLRNVKTGVEVTRNSDSDGRFVFDFVDPGDYTLMAEQTGFKKAVQENIVVRVRGDIAVDLKMTVGGVTETVTVEAAPVAVQFNSSSTLLTVENKVIDQLPIRGAILTTSLLLIRLSLPAQVQLPTRIVHTTTLTRATSMSAAKPPGRMMSC
jgi:hypothetical protein